jgi:hypothetical protein
MAEHGFIPVNHTLTEIIEFCNKMEYAEQMTGINNSQKNQKTGQHAEADSESGEKNIPVPYCTRRFLAEETKNDGNVMSLLPKAMARTDVLFIQMQQTTQQANVVFCWVK